jgi:hypothetical protein
MIIQRIKKDCRIKLFRLKYTNVGINEKIPSYLGKTGKIKENYKNLNFCTNNVLVEMEDGFSFWVSYKDLLDLSVGVNLTFNEIQKILGKDDSNTNSVKTALNIYYDFLKGVPEKEIANKYKIDIYLIPEIYFLFKNN